MDYLLTNGEKEVLRKLSESGRYVVIPASEFPVVNQLMMSYPGFNPNQLMTGVDPLIGGNYTYQGNGVPQEIARANVDPGGGGEASYR